MSLAFYVAGGVAALAALLAVTRANAVHSLLYLILSLLAIAVVFLTLGAPFAAALQVIINAGAIMVMFVFVIMLINPGPRSVRREKRRLGLRVWIVPGLIGAVLFAELVYVIGLGRQSAAADVGPEEMALALFGPYGAAIELVSLLLLAGLLGAYHLARRETPGKGE